jgi:DNA repair exonuclease SbcCD nuclease subunit
LSAAGVETFVVHGNHDPLGGWSAIREWPNGVTVFGSGEVETVALMVGRQAVEVQGISYATRDTCENLASRFRRATGKSLNIGLLHTNVGGNTDHASYAPCSLGDLDAAGMDYWALGHIHRHEFLREGGPWVAYSGDTQGRSPKPSEMGPKGVLVADASGSTVASVRFEPVDEVRFATCAVDISDISDLPMLQSRIGQRVDGLRIGNAERSLLVRVVLEGRGPVASDLHHDGALADFCAELRAGYDDLDPFVWIESLKDRSRVLLDLDALRQRDDFSSELLRLADGLTGDREGATSFVKAAAEKLGQPGQIEKALRDLEPEASEEVLAEALYLALDSLEREAD